MKASRCLRALLVSTPVALGALLAAASPACAGAISGSVNDDAQVITASHTIEFSVNTDYTPDTPGVSGSPAVKAERDAGPAVTCQVSVTASDPDGAFGTTVDTTVPVGQSARELRVVDQAPGTDWAAGDLDHFAGQIACEDNATGAIVAMVTIDEDHVAG